MSERISNPKNVDTVFTLAVERVDASISDTPWTSEVHQAPDRVDEDDHIGQQLDDVPVVMAAYDCNARRHDHGVFVGYCDNRAGKGTDHVGEGRCKYHGGAADNTGEANGNYNHGAYSLAFHESVVEWIEEEGLGLEDFEDIFNDREAWQALGRHLAPIALIKFHRSNDPRHLREFRVLCQAFDLLPGQRGEHSA